MREPTAFPVFRAEGHDRLDFASVPDEDLVQLQVRRFFFAGRFAVHPWFLAFDASERTFECWELWTYGQEPEGEFWVSEQAAYSSDGREPEPVRASTFRYGSIRATRGITTPSWPVEGVVLEEWRGEEARRLLEILRRPEDYPHRNRYHLWPGPNSNTYVAWALRRAKLSCDLHPLMVGKDCVGWWGLGAALSTTRTGLQVETPIVGAKVGLKDGIEVHLFETTFGLDLWPPALKTPLGRFGVPE